MVRKNPESPGPGYKRRRGLTFLTFDGGPADGNMVRWDEDFIPPFWNHVERKMEPVPVGEDGLPPDGVQLAGDVVIDGEFHYITEVRIWHRYRLTVRMKGQAQVFEPVGAEVPLLYDEVRGEWETPEQHTARTGHTPGLTTQSEPEVQRPGRVWFDTDQD